MRKIYQAWVENPEDTTIAAVVTAIGASLFVLALNAGHLINAILGVGVSQ